MVARPDSGSDRRTLSFDIGGTWSKAALLGPDGEVLTGPVRVPTPYPCPPDAFVGFLAGLAAELGPCDRVSVGLPGMVRGGHVLATPHFVTEAGPFTPRRADLVEAWAGWNAAAELHKAFRRPVRVVNDAEMAGVGVIEGAGFEVLLAFGTGLGAALFDDGRLLPKLELSQAPFRAGQSYDQQLGDHARSALGEARWARRVAAALDRWHAVLWWDRLYLGGGNAEHLLGRIDRAATWVGNEAGLRGGHRLWDPRPD